MSLNFVHYEAIVSAYESFVQGDSNWVLLRYADANQPDDLSLVGHGAGGLAELKSTVTELDQVHIAFYHEEIAVRPGYIVLNYIPPTVSAVKKARTFVHSRRFSAVFKVAHATLTVDHIGNLTPTAIHQAVLNPDSNHTIETERRDSLPDEDSDSDTSIIMPSATRQRSASISNTFGTPLKSPKAFKSLIRRKVLRSPSAIVDYYTEGEDNAPPPPPPPKDDNHSPIGHHYSRSQVFPISPHKSLPQPDMLEDLSEFGQLMHSQTTGVYASSASPPQVQRPQQPPPLPHVRAGSHFLIPVDRKWNSESAVVSDPEERARRRQVAQRQKQLEEEMARQEERERQEQIRLAREEEARREAREEAERRASMEEEIRRATNERRRREMQDREEEEQRRLALEMRKETDRRRRQEEHLRLQEWRKEQQLAAQESQRKEKAALETEQAERRKRVQEIAALVKRNSKSDELTSGWLTLQVQDTLTWRRRYYKLAGKTLFLYRSPKEMNAASDSINLHARVAGLREWNEGFEELKAIPHAFAVVFKDGSEAVSLFADAEADKDKLLGLITYAAGL